MFTKTSYPVARKEHTCVVCSHRIIKGDQYFSTTTFDGGDIFGWKSCLLCEQASMKALDAEYGDMDSFISVDSVLEWALEFQHVDEIAQQLAQKAE